jgi:FkbM family methyltransferase
MNDKLKYEEHFLTMQNTILQKKPLLITEPLLLAPSFLNEIRELQAVNYIINELPSKRTFVDVGSHIGFYAIPLSYYFEKVIAYEPSRFQVEYLRKNIHLNNLDNIIVKDCAVGAEKGVHTLYVMGRSGGSNTLASDVAALGVPMEKYLVDVVTLDNENLVDLDVLKIDVEGFELEVLNGAKETINICKPVIICEVWDTDHRRKDVVDFLAELNYSVCFPFENLSELAFCNPNK